MRKIIHIDCDCFYAAIEMRDDPRLRGRPLAVGGDPGKHLKEKNFFQAEAASGEWPVSPMVALGEHAPRRHTGPKIYKTLTDP